MHISDDHGIDFVGCYGSPDVRRRTSTPQGRTRFTRMFAASPT
jgi:hypothetical protein